MNIELRGVIVNIDNGVRHTRVVVCREHPDIREVYEIDGNKPVNKGTVTAEIAKQHGIKPGQVKWPHHIILRDQPGGPL